MRADAARANRSGGPWPRPREARRNVLVGRSVVYAVSKYWGWHSRRWAVVATSTRAAAASTSVRSCQHFGLQCLLLVDRDRLDERNHRVTAQARPRQARFARPAI